MEWVTKSNLGDCNILELNGSTHILEVILKRSEDAIKECEDSRVLDLVEFYTHEIARELRNNGVVIPVLLYDSLGIECPYSNKDCFMTALGKFSIFEYSLDFEPLKKNQVFF